MAVHLIRTNGDPEKGRRSSGANSRGPEERDLPSASRRF
jgi:hypothetical protein